MPADEFRGLKESIKKNGLLNPIITYCGEILDGAHRYRACQELKIEPVLEEFKGKDAFAYVFDANIKRRQLSPSHRAVLAERLRNIKNGKHKDSETDDGLPAVSMSEAAKLLSVSTASISSVRKIRKADATLIPLVTEGDMTVHAALEEVKRIEEKNKVVQALRKIGNEKLANKVAGGSASVEDGIKAIKKMQSEEIAKKEERVSKQKNMCRRDRTQSAFFIYE